MFNFVLCILLLIPSNSFASDCKDSVQVIKEGESAQCSGLLYSPDAAKKANQAFEDAKYYQDLSELLHKRNELTQKEIAVLDERLKLYMDTSQTLAEQLTRKDHEDFWQKTLYFGLGVVVTGLAVYGAVKVIK